MFMVLVIITAILSAVLVANKTYWGMVQATEYSKYRDFTQTELVISAALAFLLTLGSIIALGWLLDLIIL